MLSVRQQILAAVLDALGGIDVVNFAGRLRLQKWVFLLNARGVDLGYPFSWYLRGPYSSELTKDAFAIDQERRTRGALPAFLLPPVVNARLDELRSALGSGLRNARRLELLASVLFLGRSLRTWDSDVICSKLRELKPAQFTGSEIVRALAVLREKGFIS